MKHKSFIYGVHPVLEALKSDEQIDKIYLHREQKISAMQELMTLIRERNIPVQYVPQEKLRQLVNGNHQGIVASVCPVAFQQLEHLVPWWFENGVVPMIIILDEITDIRNFGAIARTAECAGVNAIVIPMKNSAQINAQAIKVSAGALYSIPVCRSANLNQTVAFLQNSGITVIGCTEKAEQLYTSVEYTVPHALVFGSEEYGIRAELIRKLDYLVKIPMQGNISSLNVSVSAGVVLYEAIRQRA